MMILDFSQVSIASIMAQIGNHANGKIEETMVRHMILNTIRSLKTKFGNEYSEMIIACDNKNYWRRQIFPYYKANRKKSQAASEFNWKDIFECLNKIREEIKQVFPYRVIEIETAEADDVIASLCMGYGKEEKILVLSGDKDFIQLQRFGDIKQFDPVRKKFITHNDPANFLFEHILRGDTSDGVPNILSSDNCFVVGERQKPLTQKRIDSISEMGISGVIDNPLHRNYMRNKVLIDLQEVPKDIQEKVLESYEAQSNKKSTNLFDYFMAKKLRNLTENIGDFL